MYRYTKPNKLVYICIIRTMIRACAKAHDSFSFDQVIIRENCFCGEPFQTCYFLLAKLLENLISAEFRVV